MKRSLLQAKYNIEVQISTSANVVITWK